MQFASCIFYNAIGTGKIAALGDLADVNIRVGTLTRNIEKTQWFGSPKFKVFSSGQAFLFSLLD